MSKTLTKILKSKEKFIINKEEIALEAYNVALTCYGVAGVVRSDALSKNSFEPLDESNVLSGVIVKKNAKNTFSIDIYIILASHVKITETLFETQKVIRYALNKKIDHRCNQVNVFVMAIATK